MFTAHYKNETAQIQEKKIDLKINDLLGTFLLFAPNPDYPNTLFCNHICKTQRRGKRDRLYFYSLFELRCSPEVIQNGCKKSWLLELYSVWLFPTSGNLKCSLST